jgi:hypothetical protein
MIAQQKGENQKTICRKNSCWSVIGTVHIGVISLYFTEMEFLTRIKVSGYKLDYSQTGVFVWFSTRFFLFYKMLFMNLPYIIYIDIKKSGKKIKPLYS